MSLSFGDLRRWDPADTDALDSAMGDRIEALTELEEDLRSASRWNATWTGSVGGTAARHKVDSLGDWVTDLAADAAAVREVAADTGRSLRALRHDIVAADSYASRYQFSIGERGEIVDGGTGDYSDTENEQREIARRNLEQSVAEILARGAAIEKAAADGLRRVGSGRVDDGGAQTVSDAARSQTKLSLPPEDASADENKVWWDSLTEQERHEAIERHHERVGPMVGIPPGARDAANRKNLDDETAYWDDRERNLERQLKNMPPSPQMVAFHRRSRAEVREARDKLSDLDAIRKSIDRPDGSRVEGRYLLQVDSRHHDITQAIVADGEIDSATHVSMTVPGLSTNPRSSIRGMTQEAAELRRTAADIGGLDRSDVASVAFIGYQPPQMTPAGLLAAATDGKAEEGAGPVARELQGIQSANRNPDLQLVGNGHSYGSTTLGIAAQRLAENHVTPLDDLVFYGSPGVPDQSPKTTWSHGARPVPLHAEDPRPEDLGVSKGHAYEMAAPNDSIVDGRLRDGKIGGLGLGPAPAVYGAEKLSTDAAHVFIAQDGARPSKEYRLEGAPHADAHSAYTDKGRTSQFNLAAVLSGRSELAVR